VPYNTTKSVLASRIRDTIHVEQNRYAVSS
jgi:hypothetical protein